MSTAEQNTEKLNIENEQTTQKLNEVKDLLREIGWDLQQVFSGTPWKQNHS